MTFEFQIERGNEQFSWNIRLTYLIVETQQIYMLNVFVPLHMKGCWTRSRRWEAGSPLYGRESGGRVVGRFSSSTAFLWSVVTRTLDHPLAPHSAGWPVRTPAHAPLPLHCLQTHARPGRQWLVRLLCVRTGEKGCKPLRESWESIRAFSSKTTIDSKSYL